MAEQERKFRKPRVRVEEKDEFEKKLISVRRVTKVVKGGKNMRLSALVVVGNKKGQVGMGINKAIETPAAIEKAGKAAKKALINVPIVDGTIPHEVIGKFAKTSVKYEIGWVSNNSIVPVLINLPFLCICCSDLLESKIFFL